jgi:alpha-beta hydrolase superfamily lysophospholipase
LASFADKQGIFKSSDGISEISYFVWDIESGIPCKGIVQISHGMREHSGRYADFARFLNKNGWLVISHDHLGHGRSNNKKFGYFGESGVNTLINDVILLSNQIKNLYPDKQMNLFGHSMGSFIAREVCTKYKFYSGAVFCGTGSSSPLIRFAEKLAKIMCVMFGEEHDAKLFEALSKKIYNARIKPAPTGKEWLSRDKAVYEAFLADELCAYDFKLGGYRDLFSLVNMVNTRDWAAKIDVNMPIFLISGLEDPVGEYGRGVLKVYEALNTAGNKNIYIKMYHGARHELLNELNKEEVYDDILYFFEEIMTGKAFLEE